MIDCNRFDNLSVKALKAVAELSETIDCQGVQCIDCPFELSTEKFDGFPFLSICALAYGKALYRRLTK